MSSSFDTAERKPVDFVMFAVAFTGYMMFLAGIIVSSPPLAIAGVLIKLLSVGSFYLRPDVES